MTPHRALGVAIGSFVAIVVLGFAPVGLVIHALRSFPLVADLVSYVFWQALPLLALTAFLFSAPLAAAEADDERDAQVAAGGTAVQLGAGWRMLRFLFGFLALPTVALGCAASFTPGRGVGPSLAALIALVIVGFWVTARRRQPVALFADRIVDGAGRTHAFATLSNYAILRRRGGAEQHTLSFPTGTVRWNDRIVDQPQWLAAEVRQRIGTSGHGGAR